MKLWLAIRRLLPVLAVLGVVLAPFTVPAVADGMAMPMAVSATGTDMTAMDGDMAMAEMPCCPPERPAVPDCQKACPLATLCFAKITQGILPASALSARFSIALALIPANDANPNTLAPIPPPRPPQA